VRHPREPHRRVAHPPSWRLHRGVEQRRRGPVRLGASPPEEENQENDLVVRGRERRVRTSVPLRRARTGTDTPRDSRREDQSGRCGNPSVLHPYGFRDSSARGWRPHLLRRRGQSKNREFASTGAGFQREELHHGGGDHGGFRVDQGVES
jgi:hypothetical protein